MIRLVAIFLVALLLSVSTTRLVRRLTIALGMLDAPGGRGLHTHPIPRGGGAAIVGVVSLGIAIFMLLGEMGKLPGALMLLCGLGYALLGWIDDRQNLSIVIRLIVQIALASVYCAMLYRTEPVSIGFGTALPAPVFALFSIIFMVWFVNLFNFMDGADGLACTQSTVAGGCGAVIFALLGDTETALVAAALAGACAGFLKWNWSPARIFLGDVGSYYLGFLFACLVLFDFYTTAWIWLILLTPFVVDASLTLLRRVARGGRWWVAHREHLYQRLILSHWTHARVSEALAIIIVVILLPAAIWAARAPSTAPWVTVLIYAITGIIWLVLNRCLNVASKPAP